MMADWFDELAEKEEQRRKHAHETEERRQRERVLIQQHGRRALENLRTAVGEFVARYQKRFPDKHEHVDLSLGANGGFTIRRSGIPAVRVACVPNLEAGEIRLIYTTQATSDTAEKSAIEFLALHGDTPETLHFGDSRANEYADVGEVCGLILRPVLFPQLTVGSDSAD